MAPVVRDRILTLPGRFRSEAADGFAADFAPDVDGVVNRVAVARGPCRVRAQDPAFPSARITTDAATWLSLDAGELSSMPRADLMVLPDVGHVPQFEAPRRPAGW